MCSFVPDDPSENLSDVLASCDVLQEREEWDRVREWWKSYSPGVLALLGVAGSGKTFLAATFLSALYSGEIPLAADTQFEVTSDILVFHFQRLPDIDAFFLYLEGFLDKRLRAKEGNLAIEAGADEEDEKLPDIWDKLVQGGRILLILDGLEGVLRQDFSSSESLGRIDHAQLLRFLVRVVEGELRNVAVLITSRLPLPDLGISDEDVSTFIADRQRYLDLVKLDEMSAHESRSLLRKRAVSPLRVRSSPNW